MVLIFWPWASPRILISYYVVFQTKMNFFAWFRHFFKYFDKFWLFGHIWSFLNVFGHFWTTLDTFGHFRTYLTSFEVFWCARGQIQIDTIWSFFVKFTFLCYLPKKCCKRQVTLRIVGYHFSSQLTATLNLCHIYLKLLGHVL